MKKSPLAPCPPKLAAIITDVNRFDPEMSLLSLAEAAAFAKYAPGADWFARAVKTIEFCLNHVKEKSGILEEIISRSVSDDAEPISGLREKFLAYEFFRVARLNLQSVARMNAVLRPILEERGLDEFAKSAIVSEWWSPSFWQPNDVARIRECQVCNHLFWAGRLDQRCCSPRCNHIRHSRQTRERYRQGYYQGARLSNKERSELRAAKASKRLKKGK